MHCWSPLALLPCVAGSLGCIETAAQLAALCAAIAGRPVLAGLAAAVCLNLALPTTALLLVRHKWPAASWAVLPRAHCCVCRDSQVALGLAVHRADRPQHRRVQLWLLSTALGYGGLWLLADRLQGMCNHAACCKQPGPGSDLAHAGHHGSTDALGRRQIEHWWHRSTGFELQVRRIVWSDPQTFAAGAGV